MWNKYYIYSLKLTIKRENKMIEFDNKGNLKPASPIEIDLKTLEEIFVTNPYRQELYDFYIAYLKELKEIIGEPFEQWIDGSFVSKKLKPNDIDIVSFIPNPIYDAQSSHLFELKQKFKPQIDAYYICKFPENHLRFAETKGDYFYWLNQFAKDRQKNSKGFIKIIIDNE
jgi:hypothetical protein